MPFPEAVVRPMRDELTRLGFRELTDAPSVDAFFEEASRGSSLFVINSTCGCAAGNARPAVAHALRSEGAPARLATVFAGQDAEATARAREHLAGIPPSSPFIALLNDGRPVFVLERMHIKGRPVGAIANDLVKAFDYLAGVSTTLPEPGSSGPEPAWEAPSTFRSIL
jgi:putative YphP/YqiW family bacilliredoxin